MKKMFGILLGLLFCSMGMAQETPPEPTPPSQSVTQTKRASKFQGLWQQRKGHNLRLDYGFQADLLGNNRVDRYLPIRVDLEYQYDIPWNPKRINFYAYAGFVYKRLSIDYPYYTRPHDGQVRLDNEECLGAYAGIGLKIHCTDWLHLSFAQAFNVMDKFINVTHPIREGSDELRQNSFESILIGSQTSIRIVGQIKQFSIYLGYRVDHWQKTVIPSDSFIPFSGLHENYLTFGIGYDF